jgi:hypothetical protein
MRRVLVVDEQIDKALTAVFDAAFKYGGVQVSALWDQIRQSIKEEPDLSIEE